MAWFKGLLGLFDLVGFVTRWFERRERDRLLLDAESKKRAEQTLAEAQKALKERHDIEDTIRRDLPSDNRRRLRDWSRPRD